MRVTDHMQVKVSSEHEEPQTAALHKCLSNGSKINMSRVVMTRLQIRGKLVGNFRRRISKEETPEVCGELHEVVLLFRRKKPWRKWL